MRRGLLVLLVLSLTACSDVSRLEMLGMSDVATFDAVKDENGSPSKNQIKITVDIPSTDQEGKPKVVVVEATSDSPKHARMILNRKTELVLVSGQLRDLLFGSSLGRLGIWSTLDTYYRDYSVGESARIIIVNGDASELSKMEFPNKTPIGTYVENLLGQESKVHDLPDASLHSFARDYYDDGIDPITPIVRAFKEGIGVDGIALFDDDKFVSQIQAEDAAYFMLLYQNFRRSSLFLSYRGKGSEKSEKAMLSAIINKRKVEVILSPRSDVLPEASIRVNISAMLSEYQGTSQLSEKAARQQLIRKLTLDIKERLEGVISHLQEVGTDSLGIGTYVRNKMAYGDWKKLKWKETYKRMKINVDVHLKIRDYGMIQ